VISRWRTLPSHGLPRPSTTPQTCAPSPTAKHVTVVVEVLVGEERGGNPSYNRLGRVATSWIGSTESNVMCAATTRRAGQHPDESWALWIPDGGRAVRCRETNGDWRASTCFRDAFHTLEPTQCIAVDDSRQLRVRMVMTQTGCCSRRALSPTMLRRGNGAGRAKAIAARGVCVAI
jgi:hypothetical protein